MSETLDRVVEVLAMVGIGAIVSMLGITVAVMVTGRGMDR